jgi:hypothetical protein
MPNGVCNAVPASGIVSYFEGEKSVKRPSVDWKWLKNVVQALAFFSVQNDINHGIIRLWICTSKREANI